MPSLKELSAELTDKYLAVILLKSVMNDMGMEPLETRLVKSEVDIANEILRTKISQLRDAGHLPVDDDPDSDCRG